MKIEEFLKLKPGDKVRIVSKRPDLCWSSDGSMDKWLGKVMTIKEIDNIGSTIKTVLMVEDSNDRPFSSNGWHWWPNMIECRVNSDENDKVTNHDWISQIDDGQLALALWLYLKQIKHGIVNIPTVTEIELWLKQERKENKEYESQSPECEVCINRGNASMFEPKFQTNRQWMESLSDEELAKRSFYILTNTIIDGVSHPVYASSLPNPNKKLYYSKEKVIEGNMAWLRADYKE